MNSGGGEALSEATNILTGGEGNDTLIALADGGRSINRLDGGGDESPGHGAGVHLLDPGLRGRRASGK